MHIRELANLDLVIFDLDGTLIDSNGIYNDLDVELVRSFGENKSSEEILTERDNILKTNNVGDIYMNYCEYLKAKYNSNLSKEEILQFRRDLSKCIVIEDSLSGVLAAKDANLNVIAIYDKYSDKDREKINELADYNVANFKELIELFRKTETIAKNACY